jgi:hypothetical protein
VGVEERKVQLVPKVRKEFREKPVHRDLKEFKEIREWMER